MIFTHLVKIVEQSERILALQKLSKSIHYRNSYETFKTSSLQNIRWNAREMICFVFEDLNFRNVCNVLMRFRS